jgi:hypothetical protein
MARKHLWPMVVLGFTTTLVGHQLRAANAIPRLFGQEGAQAFPENSTQRAYHRVSVEVIDPSGARIPHPHITIVDQAVGAINQKDGDVSGRAEFVLPDGAKYRVTITAVGFEMYVESFKLESDIATTVTLRIRNTGACPCVSQGPNLPPLDHEPVAVELPLQPLEPWSPPAIPIRHKQHR